MSIPAPTPFNSPCTEHAPHAVGNCHSNERDTLEHETIERIAKRVAATPEELLASLFPVNNDDCIFLRPLTFDDIYARVHNDTVEYYIRPQVLEEFRRSFKCMGQIAVCAANDFNPRYAPFEECPERIDREVMHEWGSMQGLPHISAAFNDEFVVDYAHSNPEQVLRVFHAAQNVGCFYAHWLVERIEISIRKGLNSLVNFGAYFGFTKTEFMSIMAPEALDRAVHPLDGKFYFRLILQLISNIPRRYLERALVIHTERGNDAMIDQANTLTRAYPLDFFYLTPDIYCEVLIGDEEFDMLRNFESVDMKGVFDDAVYEAFQIEIDY